jgi:DNA primase
MFPIRDGMGEVIGFGARRLDGALGPKYLNSPETLIYSKRRNVFNFAGARASAARCGKFIAVEGYLDAIAVDHAGIENVVAVLGTAVNVEQLRNLWKTAPEVVVVLDGDAAGRAAADRAIDAILPEASATSAARFAWLDAGVDPDDLVRESGVEAFRAVVERSIGLEEALWRRELARVGVLDAPERRSRAIDGILKAVAAIRDERTRALYHAALARRIELEFEIGRRLDLGTAIHDAEVNVGVL